MQVQGAAVGSSATRRLVTASVFTKTVVQTRRLPELILRQLCIVTDESIHEIARLVCARSGLAYDVSFPAGRKGFSSCQ